MLEWIRFGRQLTLCGCLAVLVGGCKQPVAEPESSSAARDQNASGQPKPSAEPLARDDRPVDHSDGKQPTTTVAKPVPQRTVIVDSPPADEPPPSKMPDVVLSERHVQESKVKQGDAMPPAELLDLAGNSTALADLLGERLTVVVCWSKENAYSTAALKELESLVLEQYGPSGVAVVGVNVGDSPEGAMELVKALGVSYPQLSDTERAYFAQLAERKLPRLYVLDAEGRILWFDIEWSRSTRRFLEQAIRYQLETASQPAGA